MEGFEPLSADAQRALLHIARHAIAAHFDGETYRPPSGDPALDQPAGAFVTLHIDGVLRGCIGRMQASGPLSQTVADMAVAAATQDPRFLPMGPDELEDVDIEISVLSPLRPIDPSQVEVGTHGLIITKGVYRGVLLPQVAVDHHFDAQRFLVETCRKAGLPADAWRDPETSLEAFTAQVFSEND